MRIPGTFKTHRGVMSLRHWEADERPAGGGPPKPEMWGLGGGIGGNVFTAPTKAALLEKALKWAESLGDERFVGDILEEAGV
ncbi:MAG: hypothetical protein KKE05_06275 [Nanoarchaeota archaeon]|nr:hypothetical protein [Nanoarchaeota archaeon]